MTEKCKNRIENILNHHHPELEPGEESITYEQAERMVDFFMAKGFDEDKAIEGLKYCLAGEYFQEGSEEKEDQKERLIEGKLDEIEFFSRMAMRKASHAGLLGLAIYVAHRAREKGRKDKLATAILGVSTSLFLWDDIELLVYAMRNLVKGRNEEKF